MSASNATRSLFESDPGEPLSLEVSDATRNFGLPAVRRLLFEFNSRGDRVSGRLLLPETASDPYPTVLLEHGHGGSKEAPYMDAAAGPWVRAGAAVASIDLPLHGQRSNPKLTGLLQRELQVLTETGGNTAPSPLIEEFGRQAVVDLIRALDALSELPEVDSDLFAFAGFSLGAIVGATFCGHDPRPRAAALALAGGGFGPASLDPVQHIARFAPRPLLFLSAEGDEVIPRGASEALIAAAGEPKHSCWFPGGHADLAGSALKAMWRFLEPHLLA
ncbi:acetylxylan esterase [Myxococcota bacterium]|nr:acetylxylan esterase [Myxococcota bacterium]